MDPEQEPVRYYYAITDDLGVLCVDQLSDDQTWTEERTAGIAESYPDAIYFTVDLPC